MREELLAALHENSEIRYVILRSAKAEAWTLLDRLIDGEGGDPRGMRMCHFCPFTSTPAAVMEHEVDYHHLTGPRSVS